VLVAFLMFTFLRKDTATANQYRTLRFLSALCAGFAGGFLAGEALFRLDSPLGGGGRLVVSGTAGCALFFTIWFTYGKPAEAPRARDQVAVSIPAGWTFEEAARAIAQSAKAVVDFSGFTPPQLAVALPATELQSPTPQVALANLRYHSPQLPAYTVEFEHGVYRLRA